MRSDEDLLAACAMGDQDAFEELFRRHRAPIFSFITRLVGNRSQAEDVFQEVFLRVHDRAASFEPRSRFAAWLYTIAHNASMDALRRGWRERWLSFGASFQDPPCETDAETEAVRAEERQRLLREVQKLEPRVREVFLLRTHGNLLFREIAETLVVPLNTVLSRYHQAVLRLKQALGDEP